MCKRLLYVALRCDCTFCPLAPHFDPKNTGGYPHFGRHLPGETNNDSWTYLEVKEPCDTVKRDENQRYISCDNPPPVWENTNKWYGEADAKIGDRLCNEWWLNEYSKEPVRPKAWRVKAAEETKKAKEAAEKEAAKKAATEAGEGTAVNGEETVEGEETTIDGGDEDVTDTEEEVIPEIEEPFSDEDDFEGDQTFMEMEEEAVEEEAVEEEAVEEEAVEEEAVEGEGKEKDIDQSTN